MAKRCFDLCLATLSLLLFAPVLLLVASLVKWGSAGPVFFLQQRVGRHGVPFNIIKFRTMRADLAASGLPLTVGADPRITGIGHFLRRTRLDELPQLFNVLKGDMSLVGPRPEVPRYVAHYPADLRARVLAVRPGITDPAALAHIDEAAQLAQAADPEREYIQHILPTKLASAVRYAETASLASDVGVLWRTVRTLWWRP